MNLDLSALPYPSMRQPVFAQNGMVATGHPLAAQAGLAVLQRGGNAVDAAIAAGAVLCVVEPSNCGPGGDAFALVWDGAKLHGLNGSGRSPHALTLDEVRSRGVDEEELPDRGWLSVTVPGAPAAWRDLHARFGRLPFAELFEAAIGYAEKGHPVAPIQQRDWNWMQIKLERNLSSEEYVRWAEVFAPSGRIPAVGEIWRSTELAQSLRLIAETGGDTMYIGELAERIAAFAVEHGGLITADDLAAHTGEWVEPISVRYRGYDVWELPPNGQGIAALLALSLLDGFDLAAEPRESAETYHLQLEAMKLAFADARRYVADPALADVPVNALLSREYADSRRALIGERAAVPAPGDPLKGGTSYLCVADADGMMVSLIQSVYSGFGSGIVVPGTGIALQNRASGFSLDSTHANALGPNKRPFHTIIPGFLTHKGTPIGAFGLIGGHAQPQGHVQIVVNTLDYGMNPQAALDATRWFWWDETEIKLDPTVDSAIAEALAARGHSVEIDEEIDVFGCGQIIWRLPSGVYVGGSDGRTDGCALGY